MREKQRTESGLLLRMNDLGPLPSPKDLRKLLRIKDLHCHDYGEQTEFITSSERLSFLLDVVKDESSSEEITRCSSSTCNDRESSQRPDLPESPFANFVVNSSISTAT